jgi:hypothetical protein
MRNAAIHPAIIFYCPSYTLHHGLSMVGDYAHFAGHAQQNLTAGIRQGNICELVMALKGASLRQNLRSWSFAWRGDEVRELGNENQPLLEFTCRIEDSGAPVGDRLGFQVCNRLKLALCLSQDVAFLRRVEPESTGQQREKADEQDGYIHPGKRAYSSPFIGGSGRIKAMLPRPMHHPFNVALILPARAASENGFCKNCISSPSRPRLARNSAG